MYFSLIISHEIIVDILLVLQPHLYDSKVSVLVLFYIICRLNLCYSKLIAQQPNCLIENLCRPTNLNDHNYIYHTPLKHTNCFIFCVTYLHCTLMYSNNNMLTSNSNIINIDNNVSVSGLVFYDYSNTKTGFQTSKLYKMANDNKIQAIYGFQMYISLIYIKIIQ